MKRNSFKRTKLDFQDFKFIVYLFFHSILCYLTFRFDKSKFEWFLMKLTASGKFENVDNRKEKEE